MGQAAIEISFSDKQPEPMTARGADLGVGSAFITVKGNYGPYVVISRDPDIMAININSGGYPITIGRDEVFVPVTIEAVTVKRYWK